MMHKLLWHFKCHNRGCKQEQSRASNTEQTYFHGQLIIARAHPPWNSHMNASVLAVVVQGVSSQP
jgi:hypothetical protein